MLKTKEVKKVWTARNKDKLIDIGYRFTGLGDNLFVKVSDLGTYDKSEVEVLCDYCLYKGVTTSIFKSYQNYVKERRNVEKDTCNDCKQEKYKDYILIKQNNGELKLGDKGYFNFKENRLKELKLYIERNKIIDKMEDSLDGRKLYQAILTNKEKPYELVLELGYDLDEVMKRKPDGFYRNFYNLEYSINKIINKLGRFPVMQELKAELNIDYRYIKYHGGFHEIKRKMNYIDKNDLVDSNGFYNASSYEYEVAEYLIGKNIKYKREQYPFEGKNYRSDFTLFVKTNDKFEKLHVEVWGYLKTNKSKVALEYNEVREIKEKLYLSKGIKYISIEPTVFLMKKNSQIIKSLNSIFSNVLKIALKCEEYKTAKYARNIADEDLYKEAIKLSNDGITLPTTIELRDKNRSVYVEILKRFDNYNNFANKFHVKTKFKSNKYWTEQKIFETYDHMINNYGKIFSKNESDNHQDDIVSDYSKVCTSFNKNHGGIKNLKLKYYLDKVQNVEFIIPENDLKWMKQVEINLSRRGNIPYTPVQQEQAKQILEKYNSNKLNTSPLG